MIHEIRIYSCLPNRLPLKALRGPHAKNLGQARVRQAGFWTALVGDGNNDLHYLLAWESLAEREQKWNAFLADPAWIKVRAEREKDGPIIANIKSAFLRPTALISAAMTAG